MASNVDNLLYNDYSDDEHDFNSERFQAVYKTYPILLAWDDPGNIDAINGGKILLPETVLVKLAEQNQIMLFKITNTRENRFTHCGVLEFVRAEANACYLPQWMMNHLLLKSGDDVHVESVSFLPVAQFVRFQPQSKDFLDISNPRAVLEHSLRNFSCLTKGDRISINYANQNYEISVLDLKPANAVSIIECDMEVEFVSSSDSLENSLMPATPNDEQTKRYSLTFRPFFGQGNRLNGKVKADDKEEKRSTKSSRKRGTPNYDYKYGLLQFPRTPLRPKNKDTDHSSGSERSTNNTSNTFQPFTGEGKTLRGTRKQEQT